MFPKIPFRGTSNYLVTNLYMGEYPIKEQIPMLFLIINIYLYIYTIIKYIFIPIILIKNCL
jgi:hypothetical protein